MITSGCVVIRDSNHVQQNYTSANDLAEEIIKRTDGKIVMALPLGLGKPCHIVNSLVDKALADHSIDLQIFTALTLEAPPRGSDLQERFLGPARTRLFGDYPELTYVKRLRANTLPENIRVNEFFFLAGRWLRNPGAQSAHISANYTHVFAYMLDRGVNVLAQLVARRNGEMGRQFSLASNTDISLDLLKARRQGKASFIVAAQANSEMPFMMGEAIVENEELDLVLDGPDTEFELFSAPRRPITISDQAIGLHAARLVRDGGTLQVGIGSIGDAVSEALILRHKNNPAFQELIQQLSRDRTQKFSDCQPFDEGLYASSEMFVNGLLELVKNGVIKRTVDGVLVHAGFFVESREFYSALREMSDEERSKFQMTSVSFTNHLYGGEEERKAARVKACFINNAMKATLLGAVISDGLQDGAVVSGVGGQFNFVTQAFALPDARSVLTLASTRISKGKTTSNIVWSFPHETVPRHMRDIVITEYGIADLRGRSDSDVIKAMLSISDSRFQAGLLDQAKQAGKIEPDYEIPPADLNNRPEHLAGIIKEARKNGLLKVFPFGTPFTETEQRLLPALSQMKQATSSRMVLLRMLRRGVSASLDELEVSCMKRMKLDQPNNIKDRFYSLLLKGALASTSQDFD